MFVKLLNENELHHNFKYKFGKNICSDFRADIECGYGLHFTDSDNFYKWLDYSKATHFRQVFYSKNMISYPKEFKYKAKVISLGKKRLVSELFDTIKIQKLAIKENAHNIKYIENPSESIQKLAVTKNPDAIRYFKPTTEVKKLAVKLDKTCVSFIF